MAAEIMLGIDFGTSYTSAGALVGGKVELVQDHGDAAIPSVVYIPKGGDLVVGSQAASRLASDPGSTVSSIKRLIGVTPEKLKAVVASTRHQVRIAGGRILMSTGAGELATEQIAAAIFARVRDLGERRFGGKVRKAVVAIPAAATRDYVAGLQRAAKLAHIEIVQVVSEPIAGALALGLHGNPVDRRLVVCDFGGGTFDVTAVEQAGLRFTPVATYGEEYLGGDDLDTAMAEAVAGSIFGRSRFNILDDRVRRMQLVQRCESVKRALSGQPSARLQMRDAFVEAGQHRTLDLVVERSWIEPIWTPIIGRAVACVAKTILRAGWALDAIDQIVLIGGSSTVPMYRAALEIAFGAGRVSTTPLAGIAVAMGAALVTARHISAGGEIPVLAPPSLNVEDDGIPIDIAL
jgi:molecular chaperone DnaK